jgi:hypothetical protein
MLPKIQHPLFSIKIPSLGKEGLFRQWLVREEKILLIGKESSSVSDKLRSVYQVVNNCSTNVTPAQMTTSDLEWVFLQLRSLTVSPTLNLSYTDPEDKKSYPVEVALKDVKEPTKRDASAFFTALDTKFEVKDTPADVFLDSKLIEEGFDVDEVLAKSLMAVWDKDGKKITDFTVDEAKEFLLDVPTTVMDDARLWVTKAPTMEYDVKYTTDAGTERSIKLNSLTDFFTL